jgi:alpha-L-fucosidase
LPKEVQKVEWVPTKQALTFKRTEEGLIVSLPGRTSDDLGFANVVKILS